MVNYQTQASSSHHPLDLTTNIQNFDEEKKWSCCCFCYSLLLFVWKTSPDHSKQWQLITVTSVWRLLLQEEILHRSAVTPLTTLFPTIQVFLFIHVPIYHPSHVSRISFLHRAVCFEITLYLLSHFSYSSAAFRKIAQAGGGGQGQGELLCHDAVRVLLLLAVVVM